MGELFNKEFISTKLLFNVFNSNLLAIPWKLIQDKEALTPTANDMIESCCILCGATGKVMEKQWDPE